MSLRPISDSSSCLFSFGHPIFAEGQCLNGLGQILLNSLELEVNSVNDKKKEYEGHSEERSQACAPAAKVENDPVDDRRKQSNHNDGDPRGRPKNEELKRFNL